MYLIQVVGYKNSGKTTLINSWVDYLRSSGYQVATIKHHGHGGEPDQVKNTDSYQHMESGAALSTVIGAQQFVMTGLNEKLSLTQLLDIYNSLNIDVVIVEGYKNIPFPKVVLLDEGDETLLKRVKNVKATCQPFDDKRNKELIRQIEQDFATFEWNTIK
ncbi:molybdopterin-guanine dinucleotide biosynthesis protein B [Gracilibacillus kekensis]|uniref:Molybdopterin-guanine dinucleotide biosynthesis protein B n=1 Tax=Gracilibacillus kekensis TaxID=1027249 RepID=A0A1M7MNY8_9BACI|nr:molybdopterin-guanine dinucleotide biosynthesis protein B [Gracilibacillus kekensis]SHM92684.1 molybdopterin-guanine dinucleotide biosynthesis protein B [Gracilibacillus kekensis]